MRNNTNALLTRIKKVTKRRPDLGRPSWEELWRKWQTGELPRPETVVVDDAYLRAVCDRIHGVKPVIGLKELPPDDPQQQLELENAKLRALRDALKNGHSNGDTNHD